MVRLAMGCVTAPILPKGPGRTIPLVVTARQRRRVVEHLKGERVSERRACRLVGFSRVAMWKPLKGRTDAKLRARLKQLAERYPRASLVRDHD